MSHLKRAALAAFAVVLFLVPSTAFAATPAATTPAPKFQRVTIGATTGVVYLTRSETKQIGQGGAWVVAAAVGASLAPATAGVGTIAAVAVGVTLGAVGSKVIDAQLAKNQCIKISVPWISLGTVAKLGWYPCII